MTLPPCTPAECGKEFRKSVHKPSPNLRKFKGATRNVPAFTVQAMQRNTKVIPPKKQDPLAQRKTKTFVFRRIYSENKLPVNISFTNRGKYLKWKMNVDKLDYQHYLPIFCEGAGDDVYPFTYFVEKGIFDLIKSAPNKVLACIPSIIGPLKNGLRTKRYKSIMLVLNILRTIVTKCPKVGEALVPYYRQLLPELGLFLSQHRHLYPHDVIIWKSNLQFQIEDTLHKMEKHGGPDAFLNIKYIIPTYESYVSN